MFPLKDYKRKAKSGRQFAKRSTPSVSDIRFDHIGDGIVCILKENK